MERDGEKERKVLFNETKKIISSIIYYVSITY